MFNIKTLLGLDDVYTEDSVAGNEAIATEELEIKALQYGDADNTIPDLEEDIGLSKTWVDELKDTPTIASVSNDGASMSGALSTPIVFPNKDAPVYQYCPVHSFKLENGSTVLTAYITQTIQDLEHYIRLVDGLERLKEGDRALLYIQSPGGFVSTGATIASCIDQCKGHVTTIARGACASAASLIWSAGHTTVVTPFALFMYHMSSHGDRGNSIAIMNNAAQQIEYVKKCLLKVCVEKGHITQEEFDTIVKSNSRDVNITAKEMMERISQKGVA